MTDCCSLPVVTAQRPGCPASGDVGRPVPLVTLRSLLTDPALGTLDESQPHFFCPGARCDVVYFSLDRAQVFRKEDVKVRVGQKETTGPRPVCYCFGHTHESIREEIERTANSTVMDDIKAKMNSVGCACEVNNPQGSCCLGNVMQVIKQARSVLE